MAATFLDHGRCRFRARLDDELGLVIDMDVLLTDPARPGWHHLCPVAPDWLSPTDLEAAAEAAAAGVAAPDDLSGLGV